MYKSRQNEAATELKKKMEGGGGYPSLVLTKLTWPVASKSEGEGGGWLIKEDKIGRFLPSSSSLDPSIAELTAPT